MPCVRYKKADQLWNLASAVVLSIEVISITKVLSVKYCRVSAMEFVKCNQGGLKLCYDGYTYTKKAAKRTRIRWECSKRKNKNCLGACTTSLSVRYLCRPLSYYAV